MTLYEQLVQDLTAAMRAQDGQRRDTLRALITMAKNTAIAQKCDVSALGDDALQAVLKRAKKQRDDAAAQYAAAGRTDLADKERAEAALIATYLPKQMSAAAVAAVVEEVCAAIGTDNVGAVIGQVMRRTEGRADGATVRALVEKKCGA